MNPATDLVEHLTINHGLDRRRVGRPARLDICPTCKTWILAGLDSDIAAIDVKVDPVPLSPLGEVLALLENRYTCGLRTEGGAYVLNIRSGHDIAAKPAGSGHEDVLRQHRHHQRPTGAMTAPSCYVVTDPKETSDEPPF